MLSTQKELYFNMNGGHGKMRRISPREAKRLMKRMGLSMGPMPDVQQVILKTSTKEIIIENPEVAVMNMHGQKIFQITDKKPLKIRLQFQKKTYSWLRNKPKSVLSKLEQHWNKRKVT
jgi:NACalpha-BTF3-like transcription factor